MSVASGLGPAFRQWFEHSTNTVSKRDQVTWKIGILRLLELDAPTICNSG
jgi:hypothetical protein